MSRNLKISPNQDAEATRLVQELLERGHALGIAIDSNYYITSGGGTLDVSFRPKLAEWRGRFIHLTPSIWEREIKRHLQVRIENSKEKVLNISDRDISILQSDEIRSHLKALRVAATTVDSTVTANLLWDTFAAETHAVTVEPPPNSANEVLNWYFNMRLPFEGSGDKKHEFPDAFALHSLDSFAASNNIKVVVVVTKDSGAYGHCAKTDRLLAFHDVQSALGAFDAKDLIEHRRQLSEEASALMTGERLARLVERLVKHINRPYEHRPQPWPAITRPIFPQNPRILVEAVLNYELIPFGNFGLPVSITSIYSGPDGQPSGPGSGVVSRIKIKIKVAASCEISAVNTNDPANNKLRQTFLLDDVIETELTFDFVSQFPVPDDERDQSADVMDWSGSPDHGIFNIEVEPLHVTVPENFEYRGFA